MSALKRLFFLLPASILAFSLGTVGLAQEETETHNISVMPLTIKQFKTALVSRLNIVAPEREIKDAAPASITSASDPDELMTFTVSGTTALEVYGKPNGRITYIELSGDPKEAHLFWQCADAVLAVLEPGKPPEHRTALLQKLGKVSESTVPLTDSELHDGRFAIYFSANEGTQNSKRCCLEISHRPLALNR